MNSISNWIWKKQDNKNLEKKNQDNKFRIKKQIHDKKNYGEKKIQHTQ